jgi:hypothetical protein
MGNIESAKKNYEIKLISKELDTNFGDITRYFIT